MPLRSRRGAGFLVCGVIGGYSHTASAIRPADVTRG